MPLSMSKQQYYKVLGAVENHTECLHNKTYTIIIVRFYAELLAIAMETYSMAQSCMINLKKMREV